MAWPRLLAAAGVGAAAGAAGLVAAADRNDGVARQLRFWASAAPILAHYKLVEARHTWVRHDTGALDAALEDLHERYAGEALAIVLGLRGLFIKIGQLASMRDDMMHPAYLARFRTLQHQVPAYPLAHVLALIESELAVPWDTVFASVEPEPLGAASIGQVHAATLTAAQGGGEVVVKVQYPGVEAQFGSDMRTVQTFCKMAMPEHLPFLDEVERQFATEFDYRGEARNLAAVRANVVPEFGEQVCIPAPLQRLCTKRVLVMERLRGVTVMDAIRGYLEHTAEAQGKTLGEVEAAARAQMRAGTAGGQGSVAHALARTSAALRRRDAWSNVGAVAWNWSLGMVPGFGGAAPLVRSGGALDIEAALQTVWACHARQLLVDGCFNADPHPGNIMILDDGRIGLVDFGQVVRISSETRRLIAATVVALCEDDTTTLVRLVKEGGMRTQRNDPWVLEMHARLGWDCHDRATVLGGLNIAEFCAKLDAMDPVVQADDVMVMPVRMAMMLMGLSYALGLNTRICVQLEPTARAVLRGEFGPGREGALGNG